MNSIKVCASLTGLGGGIVGYVVGGPVGAAAFAHVSAIGGYTIGERLFKANIPNLPNQNPSRIETAGKYFLGVCVIGSVCWGVSKYMEEHEFSLFANDNNMKLYATGGLSTLGTMILGLAAKKVYKYATAGGQMVQIAARPLAMAARQLGKVANESLNASLEGSKDSARSVEDSF